MMRTIGRAWVCVFCIALGSIVAILTDVAEAQVIQYVCAGGHPMLVNYYNNGKAALVVYQEIKYGLHHQPTVPGARYTNGGAYWWWQGFQGTLGYESGALIAWNCRQTSAGGGSQPQPPVVLPQPPVVGGRTVVVNQAQNGGQVRLNVGDTLRILLAGQGWVITQNDNFLLQHQGSGGFLLGQQFSFLAVHPGVFNLLMQQGGSTRFAVGVTIGYGSGPVQQQRDPER